MFVPNKARLTRGGLRSPSAFLPTLPEHSFCSYIWSMHCRGPSMLESLWSCTRHNEFYISFPILCDTLKCTWLASTCCSGLYMIAYSINIRSSCLSCLTIFLSLLYISSNDSKIISFSRFLITLQSSLQNVTAMSIYTNGLQQKQVKTWIGRPFLTPLHCCSFFPARMRYWERGAQCQRDARCVLTARASHSIIMWYTHMI